MLFLLLMTFILLTTVITPLLIINVRKKTKTSTPAPAPTVSDSYISDEITTNNYYIYSVYSDKSLQSTLGSTNPIQFEKIDDGEVFKMTLDGHEIGYNRKSGMILKKGIYFGEVDDINFKLFKLDNDNYIITNELEDMFLFYDDMVKAFYLVDEKYINNADKYDYVALRVTRTPHDEKIA